MADREVVIKIPEKMYKWVNDVNKFSNDYGISDFINLIKNGIQLPKRHGRLIDADTLANEIPIDVCDGFEVIDIIEASLTIIEAEANVPKKRKGTPVEEKRPVDPVYTTGIYDDYNESESVSVTDVDDIQF